MKISKLAQNDLKSGQEIHITELEEETYGVRKNREKAMFSKKTIFFRKIGSIFTKMTDSLYFSDH